MKKCLFVLAILAVCQISQAQDYPKELGLDSAKFMTKFDSAVRVTPDFGYTYFDSANLRMQLLYPELYNLIHNNPYKHISAHLEGGWEVAGFTEDDCYLIKPLRGDKYWVKQLTKTHDDDYYKSSLSLWKVDCSEGMLGVVQTTEYDANGTVTDNSSTINDRIVSMSYATPDTIGEAIVKSACK